MSFQTNLQRALKRSGLTLDNVAHDVGVHRSAVAQWLAGKTQPRGKRLADIARALNTTPAGLLVEIVDNSVVSFIPATTMNRGPEFAQNPNEMAWLELYRDINDAERATLMAAGLAAFRRTRRSA